MKKILAALAILTISLSACADRHQMTQYSELPAQAQVFIKKYFNVDDIIYIECDRDGLHLEYNVHLKNNVEIEFDHQGNFQSIDCHTAPVPEGIVPELIVNFVQTHYANTLIVEYHVEYRHLKVELSSGIELIFDLEGHFIRVDD